MALYRATSERLERLPETSFADQGWRERGDIQRLLRDQPEVLEEGLLVVAEEFSNWADSGRRIDLLCLDGDGRLVVVELKRDDDGGFMDLQAIRYAAMVANITFDQLVDARRSYMEGRGDQYDARQALVDHLGADDHAAATVDSAEPRLMLVAGGFSRELTTSVLWLNQSGLDVTCLRLLPYQNGSELLIDVTQIIPLPEAADYIVRLREKAEEEGKAAGRRERTLHTLIREGLVAAGTRIVLRTVGLETSDSRDMDDPRLSARFGPDPTVRNNIIWEHDQKAYSLSALTGRVRDDTALDIPAGGVNGYFYWALQEKPERSLWELAEEAGRK